MEKQIIYQFHIHSHKLQTQGDEYRLNNVYTAFYARLLMDNEPELQGFFETRKAIADE